MELKDTKPDVSTYGHPVLRLVRSLSIDEFGFFGQHIALVLCRNKVPYL